MNKPEKQSDLQNNENPLNNSDYKDLSIEQQINVFRAKVFWIFAKTIDEKKQIIHELINEIFEFEYESNDFDQLIKLTGESVVKNDLKQKFFTTISQSLPQLDNINNINLEEILTYLNSNIILKNHYSTHQNSNFENLQEWEIFKQILKSKNIVNDDSKTADYLLQTFHCTEEKYLAKFIAKYFDHPIDQQLIIDIFRNLSTIKSFQTEEIEKNGKLSFLANLYIKEIQDLVKNCPQPKDISSEDLNNLRDMYSIKRTLNYNIPGSFDLNESGQNKIFSEKIKKLAPHLAPHGENYSFLILYVCMHSLSQQLNRLSDQHFMIITKMIESINRFYFYLHKNSSLLLEIPESTTINDYNDFISTFGEEIVSSRSLDEAIHLFKLYLANRTNFKKLVDQYDSSIFYKINIPSPESIDLILSAPETVVKKSIKSLNFASPNTNFFETLDFLKYIHARFSPEIFEIISNYTYSSSISNSIKNFLKDLEEPINQEFLLLILQDQDQYKLTELKAPSKLSTQDQEQIINIVKVLSKARISSDKVLAQFSKLKVIINLAGLEILNSFSSIRDINGIFRFIEEIQLGMRTTENPLQSKQDWQKLIEAQRNEIVNNLAWITDDQFELKKIVFKKYGFLIDIQHNPTATLSEIESSVKHLKSCGFTNLHLINSYTSIIIQSLPPEYSRKIIQYFSGIVNEDEIVKIALQVVNLSSKDFEDIFKILLTADAQKNLSSYTRNIIKFKQNFNANFNQAFKKWLQIEPIATQTNLPIYLENSDKDLFKELINNPKSLVFLQFLDQHRSISDYLRTSNDFENNFFQLLKLFETNEQSVFVFHQISESIDASGIKDLILLKKNIINQLINSSNPTIEFQKLLTTFSKNNLPLVGKIFRTFQILYPPNILKEILTKPFLSPRLRSIGSINGVYKTIFNDLVKLHIRSGNRSMREYLKLFIEGEIIFKKLESQSKLSYTEETTLYKIYLKISSIRGKTTTASSKNPAELYKAIKADLNVAPGQSPNDRITQIYLKPIGIKSITEALQLMEESIQHANTKNQKFANSLENNTVKWIEAGTLIKGANGDYLENILQNGSVAKEYLGSDTSSDYTPLDTDTIRLEEKIEFAKFKEMRASDYGDILIILEDNGKLEDTTGKTLLKQKNNTQYEIFASKIAAENHYGLRTGFAMTDISYIIYFNDRNFNEEKLDAYKFTISKNGYYIPIFDSNGNLVFSQQEYDQLKHIFDGINKISDQTVKINSTIKNQQIAKLVAAEQKKLKTQTELATKSDKYKTLIMKFLTHQGVNFETTDEENLLMGSIKDIGSTGRKTALDESSDFDYICKLPFENWQRFDELKVSTCFGQYENLQTYQQGNIKQFRFKNVEVDGEKVNIDIGFTIKDSFSELDSDETIKTKLESILHTDGLQKYNFAIANILAAKRFFKQAGVYKKGALQGGLGGIGIETWILQNGCNFELAIESFLRVALINGKITPFEEFKKHYKIYGAGSNIKFASLENFTLNLTELGYNKIVSILQQLQEY